jgi:parvulin-like peptidyl-prolyl isomerase
MAAPNRQMPNAVGLRWADRGFAPEPPAAAPMEPCEGAMILARVGSEVILASEVLPAIDELIARYKDRLPPQQLELQRRLLIEQQLAVPIETKLIYLDVCRTVPKENLPRIEQKLGEEFEKNELPKMIQSAKVETRRELDRKLRTLGTSLERRKQAFIQRALAQAWVHQKITSDEEITYDEMLEYYRQHPAEFERPARARWEELMVRFSDFPNKEAAYEAIAQMGNRVRAGVPFAQVARGQSGGSTASEGGVRDWTHQGSLVCEELDRALFGLPVGQLSPILESEDGFHIIRVTERELAGRVPFDEAQAEIRPKIRQQRTKRQLRAYVARLREQTPVWTVFDDQAQEPPKDNSRIPEGESPIVAARQPG